jgi:hypothetical protein
MKTKPFALLLIIFLAVVVLGQQQPQTITVWAPYTIEPEKIDADLNSKIRTEGLEHSKVMWIEHYFTDVYGPRPTGSPNHEAAAKWAVSTMTGWGMKNAHLEPWEWGHPGWLPERATGFIISPVKANIKFEAAPWTPSTKGTVTGSVFAMKLPENSTEAELTSYLNSVAEKVKGGIVMTAAWQYVPVDFNEPQKRRPDDQVKAQYGPPNQNAPAAGGRGGRGGTGGRGNAAPDAPAANGRLTAQQITQRINQFLKDNPPALRLQDAARSHGIIVAQNQTGQNYDEAGQYPAAMLRNEDYGRIWRILQDGTPVNVEFNIVNHYYPEGKTSYNTIAEIPGTDKADEVVMLGGHLDSWASATGATDNAIGCAIMMEAARILETVGAKPKRTIRVALWSGEEEGLRGSLAYVKSHFGSAEMPKQPEYARFDAYWNIDSGTGRVRGAGIFGPAQSGVILAQFLKPFEDFGIYGASTTNSRATGGTDSTSFNNAGLPGIGGAQDPIEYNSHTHHTNLDTYERIVPEDVMKDAVITASVVYHIANRDKMMPRFPGDEMPALPAPAPAQRGTTGQRQ